MTTFEPIQIDSSTPYSDPAAPEGWPPDDRELAELIGCRGEDEIQAQIADWQEQRRVERAKWWK